MGKNGKGIFRRKYKVKPFFYNDEHQKQHRIFKSTLALILPWWVQNIYIKKLIRKYVPDIQNIRKSKFRGNLAGRKLGKIAKYTIGLFLPVWVTKIVAYVVKAVVWIVYRVVKIILFFLPIDLSWINTIFEEVDFDAISEMMEFGGDLEMSPDIIEEISESTQETAQEYVQEKIEEQIVDTGESIIEDKLLSSNENTKEEEIVEEIYKKEKI